MPAADCRANKSEAEKHHRPSGNLGDAGTTARTTRIGGCQGLVVTAEIIDKAGPNFTVACRRVIPEEIKRSTVKNNHLGIVSDARRPAICSSGDCPAKGSRYLASILTGTPDMSGIA